MKSILVGAAMFAAVVSVYACSDHHDDDGHSHIPTDEAGGHTSPYPTCQKIIDDCHEYDVGDGPVHECHEVAHDAENDSACVAKKDECTKTCAAAAADAGGGSDAGSDG